MIALILELRFEERRKIPCYGSLSSLRRTVRVQKLLYGPFFLVVLRTFDLVLSNFLNIQLLKTYPGYVHGTMFVSEFGTALPAVLTSNSA